MKGLLSYWVENQILSKIRTMGQRNIHLQKKRRNK